MRNLRASAIVAAILAVVTVPSMGAERRSTPPSSAPTENTVVLSQPTTTGANSEGAKSILPFGRRKARAKSPEIEEAALSTAPVIETPTKIQRAVLAPGNPVKRASSLVVGTSLGEIGYANGIRLSNLGGRQEIFVPLPQGDGIDLSELALVFDDVSAHEARRSLEILVNDRSISSIALDGKSSGRVVHIPLTDVVARDGFLKLSFLYSGAATSERCIDVRYVGDSLTIRPESAVELTFARANALSITATASLMPHNVSILLSNNELSESDFAAALTLARSLSTAGRRVIFHHGLAALPQLVKQANAQRWDRGLIVVGQIAGVTAMIDAADRANATDTSLMAARIGGVPVLLVSDSASARGGRLLGNPTLAALRDTRAASVGAVTAPKGPSDRVSFDQLGLVPAQAEVFGRADMAFAIPTGILPSGTRPSRLVLDVMVAPDGNDQKAVVSTFVNERLLASTVAAIGEPTHLDFPLPDGLVGMIANVRVVVQRRSAQGDCRFEPQGYPAEILGSSAIILSPASARAEDFSDLAGLWTNGVEVLIPASAATRPLTVLGVLSDVLNALSRESAPLKVKFVEAGVAPMPRAPFIAVNDVSPAHATLKVKFDRGRVAVTDRSGNTRLDLGGLTTGAVAQIVTSNNQPGLWIKPLATDGALPVSTGFFLDRGDVAFLDKTGVALAMSTLRHTLLKISYPDEASWLSFAERFRSWIIGGLWAFATITLLIVLQRIYRRRRHNSNAS